MASRYWVGGAAAWDATIGTKWAATSGGAGGQSIPTSADDVFFDAASGAVAVTQSGAINAKSVDFTGFTGSFTQSSTFNVFGSLTLSSGMTYAGSGSMIFQSTGSETINLFNKISTNVNFQFTTAGAWTLQSDLTNGSGGSVSLNNGTFNANGYNVTVGAIASLGSNVRTINMGSGTWTTTGAFTTSWNITGSNATVNASTSTLKIMSIIVSRTFNGAGLTYNNIWFASTSGTDILSDSNTFNDLKIDPGRTIAFQAGSIQTVTTLTAVGNVSNQINFSVNPGATLTTSGSYVVPAGVTSILVELWGAGGLGGGSIANTAGGGGGAGGQYSKKVVSVTPGSTYNYTVGAGQTNSSTGNGAAGNDSTFFDTDGTTVLARAKGGAGGTGATVASTGGVGALGSTTGGVGDVVYRGGNGTDGTSARGGSGGGGAGSTGNGGDASAATGGTGTAVSGGTGGAGRNTAGAGNAGAPAGGGAGGGFRTTVTSQNGGTGPRGQGRITPVTASIVDTAGTNTVQYVTLQGIVASGGATFNAFTSQGNIDGGSNSGWNFTAITTTDQTQSGNTRVTATTDRTQTGNTRITSVVDRTQPANTRITSTTTRDQSANTRIATVTSRTQLSNTRVTTIGPAIKNFISRPNFIGSGTNATGWGNYASGTTITGSRSVSAGQQTVTATSLVGSPRRFGMSGTIVPRVKISTGDVLYYHADLDTSGMAAGTQFALYYELRNAAGTTFKFGEFTVNPGATEISGYYTLTDDCVSLTPYFWVKAASDWTGTSTAIVSKLLLTVVPTTSSTTPYFDGNSVDASWDGSANASTSTKFIGNMPGNSRIQKAVDRVQAGAAYLSSSITTQDRDQLGNINIFGQSSQIIPGNARVSTTVDQPQLGSTRLALVTSRTQPGNTRVQKILDKDQTGAAKIGTVVDQPQSGNIRIQISTIRSILANMRIAKDVTTTQLGNARIARLSTKNQPGNASIFKIVSANQTAHASINKQVSRTQAGAVFIIRVNAFDDPPRVGLRPQVSRVDMVNVKPRNNLNIATSRGEMVYERPRTEVINTKPRARQ